MSRITRSTEPHLINKQMENTKQKQTERVLCIFQFFSCVDSACAVQPYSFVLFSLSLSSFYDPIIVDVCTTKHLSESHVCVPRTYLHTKSGNSTTHSDERMKEMDLMPSPPHYSTSTQWSIDAARCNRMCSRLYRLTMHCTRA